MWRVSEVLLRRGKPRPRSSMFPDKYRRVPTLLKPQQGGQQHFSEFLIRTANEELQARGGPAGGLFSVAEDEATAATGGHPLLPQMDMETVANSTTEDAIRREMAQLTEQDVFQTQRGFNERQWYEQERETMRATAAGVEEPKAPQEAGLPERVLGVDYFQSCFGYSLVKGDVGGGDGATSEGLTNYAQLDLWGEMPKYTQDMVFLYLVSRRRNTYAVAYDYDGRRLLNTYTAGNRGLKGGDRGFRGDGSTDNGHQVTSMYLNDLLPIIRERRAESGRPVGKGEKISLVVRVMGFYNGRQGAVRAVQDRSSDFSVRYLEDITPFPQNGPKMPRGVFK